MAKYTIAHLLAYSLTERSDMIKNGAQQTDSETWEFHGKIISYIVNNHLPTGTTIDLLQSTDRNFKFRYTIVEEDQIVIVHCAPSFIDGVAVLVTPLTELTQVLHVRKMIITAQFRAALSTLIDETEFYKRVELS